MQMLSKSIHFLNFLFSLFQRKSSKRWGTPWTGHQGDRQPFMLKSTPTTNLELPVKLTGMSLGLWEKADMPSENPNKHRENSTQLNTKTVQLTSKFKPKTFVCVRAVMSTAPLCYHIIPLTLGQRGRTRRQCSISVKAFL